jgi:LAO/AO transport system kinase
MMAMVRYAEGSWKPPIVSVSATAGDGIDELVARLDAHWNWLSETGERDRRRVARAREEVSAIAVAEMRRHLGGLPGQTRLDELAAEVACGKLDPYSAADELLARQL